MKETESIGFGDGFCMRGMRKREQVILDFQISVLGKKSVGREASLEGFLNLNFSTYKMGIIISTSQGYHENSITWKTAGYRIDAQ